MREEELPGPPREGGTQRVAGTVSELLKGRLKGVAGRNKVAARLVATSDHIEAIAADDAADVPALKGWRREIFGEKAVALKRGELWVAVDGSRLAFEPREAPPRPEKSGKRRRSRKKKSAEQTDESCSVSAGGNCVLYTSPSTLDRQKPRMAYSA